MHTHTSTPSRRWALTGLSACAATIGLLLAPAVQAQQSPLVGFEDIDLFVKAPPTADIPNVLLALDTSANWSARSATACLTYSDGTPGPHISDEQGKKIAIQKCALVNTLLALPTNDDGSAKFRVGIMYMNAPNADGGYPRVRFLPVDATNKPLLATALKNTSISSAADQGSNADYARALWEAYLWYGGRAPYKGRAQTNASRIRYDNGAFSNGLYVSPASSNCSRNFVIIISNGSPQGREDDVRDLVRNAGGNVTEITYPSGYVSTNDRNNWADETSRFLRGVDVSSQDGTQNITTYTVAITVANPTPSETQSNNFIKEIAVQGGGIGYSATNVDELTDSLNAIFNQIQAVNSVYAAASLPISVNSQGTFLNQVFLGVFRPDGDALPRWVGNLKHYQFGYNAATQSVTLVDANNNAAINPATGFIAPQAKSFWTTSRPYLDFWSQGSWPGEVNAGGVSDSPDGQLVEKGGAAQRLRESFMTSQTARTVYTCVTCNPGNLRSFVSTDDGLADIAGTYTTIVSGAPVTVTSRPTGRAIIDWARGTNNNNEKGPATVTFQPTSSSTPETITPTVRPTIHGDIVHSSPAVINFGGSTGVVVFYGTNSGMLHAVRGAQSGTGAGTELWSFVPTEFLGKLKRQRDNDPPMQYATTNMSDYPDAKRKDYGMDGPITFYQKQGSDARAYLYVGMRRGGRALYAFDVTTPASPRLLWKKDNNSDGLGRLGQTWSEARVTRIQGISDPVLIMGGGYDPQEDDPSLSDSDSPDMGNIVVVLNARTGAVLKVFEGLDRPVPASVAIVDGSGDGKMDRAYAVDLGGNVYRLAFPDADPNGWSITKIADFSASTGTGQKMFYAPAVTKTGLPNSAGTGNTFAVQVGTGDREKPLKASGTDNRFFTVLDKGQSSAVEIDDLTQMTMSGLSTVPTSSYGCYFNLPNAGEKVVNAPTYTSGFTFFGTNSPSPDSPTSCVGNLGTARTYAVPALCGPVSVNVLEGGGFPPTAVVGTVFIAGTDGNGQPVNCEVNPELCSRVPVGIGVNPPDCAGTPSTMSSSIGATNIYACAPKQRFRRDWSIRNPR